MQSLPAGPEQVAELVVFLAHPECELSGEIFTAGLGRFARVFIGVTDGIFEVDATAEVLRDRLPEICSEASYFTPMSTAEEAEPFFRNFEATPVG